MDELVEQKEGFITLPLKGLTKTQIEVSMADFINSALEHYSAAELYVYFKQAEHAISEAAIKLLKERAFEDVGERFKGEATGEVLGHKVALSYPVEWVYSANIAELKAKQQAELKAAQLTEQANGTAKRIDGAQKKITVTLKP